MGNCSNLHSIYRESSAQTIPWQPDAKPSEDKKGTPEVLYLDKLEWGKTKLIWYGNDNLDHGNKKNERW